MSVTIGFALPNSLESDNCVCILSTSTNIYDQITGTHIFLIKFVRLTKKINIKIQ